MGRRREREKAAAPRDDAEGRTDCAPVEMGILSEPGAVIDRGLRLKDVEQWIGRTHVAHSVGHSTMCEGSFHFIDITPICCKLKLLARGWRIGQIINVWIRQVGVRLLVALNRAMRLCGVRA